MFVIFRLAAGHPQGSGIRPLRIGDVEDEIGTIATVRVQGGGEGNRPGHGKAGRHQGRSQRECCKDGFHDSALFCLIYQFTRTTRGVPFWSSGLEGGAVGVRVVALPRSRSRICWPSLWRNVTTCNVAGSSLALLRRPWASRPLTSQQPSSASIFSTCQQRPVTACITASRGCQAPCPTWQSSPAIAPAAGNTARAATAITRGFMVRMSFTIISGALSWLWPRRSPVRKDVHLDDAVGPCSHQLRFSGLVPSLQRLTLPSITSSVPGSPVIFRLLPPCSMTFSS